MTKNKSELGQNFVIENGKIIKDGIEIKPRPDITPVPKPKKDKKNNSPENNLKKRMRWFKNSFLTDQQVTDEKKQIDDHIA